MEDREALQKRIQDEQAYQRKMLTSPKMSLQSILGGLSQKPSRDSSQENTNVNQSMVDEFCISSDSDKASDGSSQNEFEESTSFSQTKHTVDSSIVNDDKKE